MDELKVSAIKKKRAQMGVGQVGGGGDRTAVWVMVGGEGVREGKCAKAVLHVLRFRFVRWGLSVWSGDAR